MSLTNYYYVRGDDHPDIGMARPIRRDRKTTRPILRCVLRGGEIENWQEWEYRLERAGFGDYQPEIDGLRLCSEAMKDVLESARSSSDFIQWLPAWVTSQDDAERRRYWVLHFPDPPDVIDEERSIMEDFGELRLPMKGVIDPEKVRPYSVMPTPERFVTSFMVSETVRQTLLAAGCTGIAFEPAHRL